VTPEIVVGAVHGSRLVDDYLRGAAPARAFYPARLEEEGALEAKVAEVDGRLPPAARARVRSAIRPGSAVAAAKLERILAGDGYFVTTGQQPGLFLGPLYTTHKLLSAVSVAASLEERLGRPVAPLFWVASDDHDWEEANHVQLLNLQNDLCRLELAGDGGPARALRHRVLGPEVGELIDQVRTAVPPSEFAEQVLDELAAAYAPGRTLSEAFAGLLLHWFGRFDILLVDAGHPAIKEAARPILEQELREQAERERLLSERAQQLEAAGYHVQVPILPAAANVFMEDGEGRERLVRGDEGWTLRRSGQRIPEGELFALLAAEPERFSANVLLRPVVESALFPTLGYVAGPGELAYLAQTDPLFEAAGIHSPFAVPRRSVLLVEAKIRKVLDKFGLEADGVRRPSHEVASVLLRDEMPKEIEQGLAALQEAITAGFQRLEAPVLGLDPTLERPLRGARNESLASLHEIEKRVLQHLRQRNSTGLQQLDKARANLFPGGVPQERVLALPPYLVRYGSDLLDAIADAIRAPVPAESG
jgi:bacillithiol synthase